MPRKFSSFQNTRASNLQEQASANAYSATQQTTKQSSKEADGLQQQLLARGSQECLAVMDMCSCGSRYSLGNLEGTAIPSEPDFGLSWSPSCVVAAEWGS